MIEQVREYVGQPGRYEGLSAFDIWLVQSVEEYGGEDETGSTEFGEWAALMGRHIVSTDDRGFWYVTDFDSRDEARDRFVEFDNTYAEWCGEDDF